jgi:hypothetical protein
MEYEEIIIYLTAKPTTVHDLDGNTVRMDPFDVDEDSNYSLRSPQLHLLADILRHSVSRTK